MHYLVQPKCTTPQGEPLALSINQNNPSGQLIVNTVGPANADRRAQLWTPIYYFDAKGIPLGMALINALTGTALSAGANDSGAPAISVSALNSLNQWSTWTLGSDKGGYFALRPLGNDNLNLNVRGNSYPAGTSVIVHSWDKGDANEIWRFVNVDFNPPN